MPRYMIELPHETEVVACIHAARALLESGSHFLTHADFGCHDGDHRAWITVEADSREEARCVVPPIFRSRARVIALNRFSLEELDELLRIHTAPAADMRANS